MNLKVDYVLRAPNTDKSHACHWPGCGKSVKPAVWGCRFHWFKLPKTIRDAIWRAYRPGQEIRKDPSSEYIKAAKAAQDWINQQVNIRGET
jgi:hypothetical protein